jgi:hypothetical protein
VRALEVAEADLGRLIILIRVDLDRVLGVLLPAESSGGRGDSRRGERRQEAEKSFKLRNLVDVPHGGFLHLGLRRLELLLWDVRHGLGRREGGHPRGERPSNETMRPSEVEATPSTSTSCESTLPEVKKGRQGHIHVVRVEPPAHWNAEVRSIHYVLQWIIRV